MKKKGLYFVLIGVLVVADQFTKWLVTQKIALYSTVTVIPGFFNITHIHNRGAIFGAFGRTSSPLVYIVLTLASLTALGLVVYFFIKTPPSERGLKISLSLILAGAIGNLIDRLSRGHVVDFLDFYVGRQHWPFFNVADSSITVGTILLVFIFLIRKPKCSLSCSASDR